MASASYDTSGSGRLLPQSLDSERSVLGSMFRSNDVIGDVVQILNVDNFYSDAHQKNLQSYARSLRVRQTC